MNANVIIITVVIVLVLLIISIVVIKRLPRKLKVDKFAHDWKQLQGLCRDKGTWSAAILDADKLLDKALKRRKFKGKSMGERIVSAQRKISNNDQLWFAHNLAKKLKADPAFKLKETDVKTALIGFRQALRDLGALQSSEPSVAKEVEK
jgi:hypothetical protein